MSEQDKMTSQAKSDCPIDQLKAWQKDIATKVFDVLNSIESIPSQKERIKLVMDKLFDGKNNVSSVLNNSWNKLKLKDQETAMSFKNVAYKFYDKQQKLDALLSFTEAITHVIPNTELSSLLYNSRSEVLFELGMFESCLEDIERISCLLLPQKYKRKYFYHRATCHRKIAIKLLLNYSSIIQQSEGESIANLIGHDGTQGEPIDRGNEVCYKPPLPVIEKKNALIPGLSDAVELNYTNELGRFITATRDISPGELIGVCKSHITTIAFSERLNFCWHCTKQVWNGVPCDRCPCVIYCSDYCREKSFEAYHDYECIVLPYFGNTDVGEVYIMALRITIQAYKECGCKIDKLISKYDIDAEPPTKDELFKSDHDPNKYLSIHMLSIKYNSSRNIEYSNFFAQSLIIAYYLGVSIGLVKLDKSLSELKKYDKFMYLVGFIERNMRIISLNCINQKFFHISKSYVTFSSKITPGTMHFKQQCYTDIERIRQGEYELIYTLNGIKKGQTVGDSYLFDFAARNVEKRRAAVKSIFNFYCNCNACINDWSVDYEKPSQIDLKEWEKFKNDFSNAAKRVVIMDRMASDYLRKNGKICDSTKCINDVIKVVESCQTYLKPNSAIFVEAKNVLTRALELTRVPFIFPE